MWRAAITTIAVAFAASIFGCGGGSGGGGGSSSSVAIQSFTVFNNPAERRARFIPKTVTVVTSSSASVTWINQDSIPHRIVSGIVVADGNPGNAFLFIINLGFFSPDSITARAGDTIRVNNLSGRQFRLEVVDDDGAVISTVVLNQGEMRSLAFPGPGVFILRDADSQQIATLTLLGAPVPDGHFDSGVLMPGEVFTRVFTVPRTYPYYDTNPAVPGMVYTTGTVVVQ